MALIICNVSYEENVGIMGLYLPYSANVLIVGLIAQEDDFNTDPETTDYLMHPFVATLISRLCHLPLTVVRLLHTYIHIYLGPIHSCMHALFFHVYRRHRK